MPKLTLFAHIAKAIIETNSLTTGRKATVFRTALGDNHQAEVRLSYSNAVSFHAFWSYRQMVVACVNSEEINSDRLVLLCITGFVGV